MQADFGQRATRQSDRSLVSKVSELSLRSGHCGAGVAGRGVRNGQLMRLYLRLVGERLSLP